MQYDEFYRPSWPRNTARSNMAGYHAAKRQRDRAAPRRYAADQMQACYQDHRRGGNRLRLEVPAGRVGHLLVIAVWGLAADS